LGTIFTYYKFMFRCCLKPNVRFDILTVTEEEMKMKLMSITTAEK